MKHEKKETKAQEKKEHMARKMKSDKKYITGPSGKKFEIIDKPVATHSWPKGGVG